MILQNTTVFSTSFYQAFWASLIAFVFLFAPSTLAQGTQKRGEIIDTVLVSGTNESFALYLPNSYDSLKASPIIFVFEPAARGRVGISPFVESAEKHGIIVVCSNNSRNGPFEKNFALADKLFNHIFKNYKINVRQMFLSGFSGGSRLASAIAVLSGQFTGVIACGAGFSPNSSQIPSPFTNSFLYTGICGMEDMNYDEMFSNKKYLDKLKFENTLFSFNGGHQWPNKTEINRAVDWLFLHTHKVKRALTTTKEVKDAFLSDYLLTQRFLENDELLFAQENYERIIKTYPESIGLDSVRSRHMTLKKSKQFDVASKKFAEALVLEEGIKKKLFDRLRSDLNKKEINFKWWTKESEKLNQIEQKGHKETKRMIARVRYSVLAAVYESKFSNPRFQEDEDLHISLAKKFRQILYTTE